MFWSFPRPGDKLGDLLLTWIVYSLLAWVFLSLIRQCRIAAFATLFLAGTVCGWLDEGVVVDTLYGNATNPFPASISFTGLAWHAMISVGVGWYWQANVLTAGHPGKIALFSAAVGLGWGLWAGGGQPMSPTVSLEAVNGWLLVRTDEFSFAFGWLKV